jgi:hypothetical protein
MTELYQADGRLLMAQSLQEQHPDVTTIVRKYGRWQHEVDYSRFEKNFPVLRKSLQITEDVNEYGMEVIQSAEFERR